MRLGSKTAAFLWGLAEATFFFIVPDVLITCLALKSLKSALLASLVAALGATLGGMVWTMANAAPGVTMNMLLQVPGISETTFQQVHLLLTKGVFQGMMVGAFSGVPFKVFATGAGIQGINPALFAILTPLVRLPRFVLLSLLAWALSKAIGQRLQYKHKLALTTLLWVIFYMAYFSLVGW